MDFSIRPLRRDDPADVDASFDVGQEALRHDIPDFPPLSRIDYHRGLLHPWPGQEVHHWVAVDGADVVGTVMLELPVLDNLHMGYTDIQVRPAYRRRGVGSALYRHAADFVRSVGRVSLKGEYVKALPGGPHRDAGFAAFAAAMGAQNALDEVRRELDITTVDRAMWTKHLEDARAYATGYRIVAWGNHTPEEYVDDVATLDGRLILDSPQGDLDIEPDKVDRARIRAGEETVRQRGRRNYNIGAVHEESGRLAAWTAVGFDPDETKHAWQHITIVDPGHRGHRLGMLVKVENLVQALDQEPALRLVTTWNAAENAHMIAINEALGFRAVDAWVAWQQSL